MEMRASDDTAIAGDLTLPLQPIAAALHDRFLSSHCSSCFLPLLNNNPNSSQNAPIPCPSCSAAVLYCSPRCSAADSPRHASSGECRLLRLPSGDDTAGVRAALRLLHSLDTLGLLPLHPPPVRRLGGILVSGIEEAMEEGGEMAERIREESGLMLRARNVDFEAGGGLPVEMVALWAVVTNGVEVQVGEVGALGIAVYGPRFSWFNHSCVPNACFRFELCRQPELAVSGPCDWDAPRVDPAGSDEADVAAAWEAWSRAESESSEGLCWYGPRIVVRSIKQIKKGEEVCITYTDILQPKSMRHADLWPKYRFLCCCLRCSSSPKMYVDSILMCNARDFHSKHSDCMDTDYDELVECIDQAIDSYMLDENPKACCELLEYLLVERFQNEQFEKEKLSHRKFMLHPLHYLCLNAYVTLVSAYKTRTSTLFAIGSGGEMLEATKLCRAATAYSLLLLGSMFHLFLSEASLIASFTLYAVSAGESILQLLKYSARVSSKRTSEREFSFAWNHSKCINAENPISWDEFTATVMKFFVCISSILPKSWAFLVHGFPYLQYIKDPVNFSWLGIPNLTPQVSSDGTSTTIFYERLLSELDHTNDICGGEDMLQLTQLAVHCLVYGRYLAGICYGSRCYLVEHAENLLGDINQTLRRMEKNSVFSTIEFELNGVQKKPFCYDMW